MAHVADSGIDGDVLEAAATLIFEEMVAVANGRYEEIRQPIVVDVGERTSDSDRVGHAQPRRCSDVPELAAARIAPQFTAAALRHEEQIGPAIVVDVGGAHCGAVIVVIGFVRAPRIVDDTMNKSDAARRDLVGELKVVTHRRFCRDPAFLHRACEQPGRNGIRHGRGGRCGGRVVTRTAGRAECER